jgi:hypothetical protein
VAYLRPALAIHLPTGLTGTLGVRLLDLSGAVTQAFSTTNVEETEVGGNYRVAGGYSVPNDHQGYLQWGDGSTWYAEEEIDLRAASVADVWTHTPRTLTQSAAQVEEIVQGNTLHLQRSETWNFSLTGLGNLTGYDKIWFTVKKKRSLPDTESEIQVEIVSGLLYAGKAPATDSSQGSITVDDLVSGDLSFSVDEAATQLIETYGQCLYSIKWKSASGDVLTLTEGSAIISGDITRAIN